MAYRHQHDIVALDGDINGNVKKLLFILQSNTTFPEHLVQEIISLVDLFRQKENLLNIVSSRGYDILQLAVANNLTDVVERIINTGHNVGMNDRNCSNLLSIACLLGFQRMAKLLLERGADPWFSSHTCFPKKRKVELVCGKPVCCSGGSEITSPLQLVISTNNVQLLQLMLQCQKHGSPNPRAAVCNIKKMFNYCIEYNSWNCLKYLMDYTNAPSKPFLCRPLLIKAFKKSWDVGINILKYGAMIGWNKEVFYASYNDDPFGEKSTEMFNILSTIFNIHTVFHWQFYDTVKAFLDVGYEVEYLQKSGENGLSPFDSLLFLVGTSLSLRNNAYYGLRVPSDQKSHIINELVRKQQDDIFKTIQFVINENLVCIDTREKVNRAVDQLMMDWCSRLIPRCDLDNMKELLNDFNKVLSFILRNSSYGLNSLSNQKFAVIPCLVKIMTVLAPVHLDSTWPFLHRTFELMLQHGLDANVVDNHGTHPVSLLILSLNNWLAAGSKDMKDPDLSARCTLKVQELVDLLYQYGLVLDPDVTDLCLKHIMTMCNGNIQVKHDWDAGTVLRLRSIVATMFCYGTDPNQLLMIQQLKQPSGVPVSLHTVFYLARAMLVSHPSDCMQQFFQLFSSTLHQGNFNALCQRLVEILTDNFMPEVTTGVVSVLKSIKGEPRSLQTLCRIVVWDSIGWNIRKKISLLPWPCNKLVYNTGRRRDGTDYSLWSQVSF